MRNDGGETERSVAVAGSSVGVAAELAVVRPPGVGRFDDPSQTEPQRLLLDARQLGAAALDLELVDARAAEPVSHGAGVVATIEAQGADLGEQTGVADCVEGGCEHAYVVAVGPVDRPADRDAVAFGGDGPLPAQLRPISGVRAGSFAAVGSLVQLTIEGHIVEIEPDDPVERGERFGLERVEHPGVDPLVAAPSQGRVGHLVIEDRFDVDPRRSGHQADEDPSEAQPVRHAGAGDSRVGGSRPPVAAAARPLARWRPRLRARARA